MAKVYIEREDALKGLEDSDIGFCDDEPIQTRNSALKIIQNIPAADVAPVVHGRWREMDKGYYVCSACNTFITVNYGYKYCPNCGAKMDGGQDDA